MHLALACISSGVTLSCSPTLSCQQLKGGGALLPIGSQVGAVHGVGEGVGLLGTLPACCTQGGRGHFGDAVLDPPNPGSSPKWLGGASFFHALFPHEGLGQLGSFLLVTYH